MRNLLFIVILLIAAYFIYGHVVGFNEPEPAPGPTPKPRPALLPLKKKMIDCPRCMASGQIRAIERDPCAQTTCDEGQMTKRLSKKKYPCPFCRGRGYNEREAQINCPRCRGVGQVANK
ncbi:MAG: hypothetical protein AAF514_16235 [Verrucomicrobiota bacterium]